MFQIEILGCSIIWESSYLWRVYPNSIYWSFILFQYLLNCVSDVSHYFLYFLHSCHHFPLRGVHLGFLTPWFMMPKQNWSGLPWVPPVPLTVIQIVLPRVVLMRFPKYFESSFNERFAKLEGVCSCLNEPLKQRNVKSIPFSAPITEDLLPSILSHISDTMHYSNKVSINEDQYPPRLNSSHFVDSRRGGYPSSWRYIQVQFLLIF